MSDGLANALMSIEKEKNEIQKEMHQNYVDNLNMFIQSLQKTKIMFFTLKHAN
jgi:hypothetical protein